MSSKAWLSLFQNDSSRGGTSQFLPPPSVHNPKNISSTHSDPFRDKNSSPPANSKGDTEEKVAQIFFDSNSHTNIPIKVDKDSIDKEILAIRSLLLKRPPDEDQSFLGVELLNNRKVLDIKHGIRILGTCGPNPHICFALIKRASDWESVKIFFSEIPLNMKNEYVCSAYIKRAAERDFQAFNDACEKYAFKMKGLVLSNIIIDGFGKWGKMEKVIYLFNEAKKGQRVDSYSYASFIDACGRGGMMREAIRAFVEAREKGLLDSVVYASFIDAYEKNGKMEKAIEVFEEAKKKDLVDAKTFNILMNGAIKRGNLPFARNLFNEALRKKIANKVTYSIMIDGCVWGNKIGEAIEILKTTPELPIMTKQTNSIANQVDLHGFSHGVGVAYILNNVENTPFVMVVGMGHQGNNEAYSFRNTLIEYFRNNPKISVRESQIPGSILVLKNNSTK